MTDANPIHIPLINPNEPECLLVEIFVQEKARISAGDPICSLETTKSAQVLHADEDGFIVGISAQAGQIVRTGDIFCYLADDPNWQPVEIHPPQADEDLKLAKLHGLRITQPALNLANEKNINIEDLPHGPLITEKVILGLLDTESEMLPQMQTSNYDPSSIIIYGGGGHGKSLIDLLRSLNKYRIVGILDDGIAAGEEIMGIHVLGGREMLPKLYAQGIRTIVNAVGGIGNISIRIKVFEEIGMAEYTCPTVIHPTAFVESSAHLSEGIQIFPHAYIGSESDIGYGVIINTSAVVSHDCIIGEYSNISPGAILAGGVKVGRGVLIGMGATINLQVTIGDGARIGNGATIKTDVPNNGIVRAGSIWPE